MRPRAALVAALMVAVLGLAATAAQGTSGGYTGMTKADLTIHHALVGCHAWSLNGGASEAAQHVVLRAGRSFTLTNADNCPHKLVQTGGPTEVTVPSATLDPLQMPLRVTLVTPGTYTFTTEEGAPNTDQPLTGFARMRSYGPDNQLELRVTVLPPAPADE